MVTGVLRHVITQFFTKQLGLKFHTRLPRIWTHIASKAECEKTTLNNATIPKDTLLPIRQAILAKLDTGTLNNHEIARELNIYYTTVGRIYQIHRPNLPLHQGGRPSTLTPINKRHAARLLLTGKAKTAIDVHHQLKEITNKDTSVQIVRNGLKEVGVGTKKKVKKPALTAANKKARMAFAQKYYDWTVED